MPFPTRVDSIPTGTTLGPISDSVPFAHALVTLMIPKGAGKDAGGFVRIDIKDSEGEVIHHVQETLTTNAWLDSTGGACTTFFIPLYANQSATILQVVGAAKVTKFELMYA